MVAWPCDHCPPFPYGGPCVGWRLGVGSLHLHAVLMPDRSKAYEGVLALVFGILLLARLHHPAWLTVAIVLVLATLLSPWLARWIAFGWTKLAELIGSVVSRVLLAVVFFLVLTPMALLRRITGSDPLTLNEPNKGTWVERDHLFTAKDLDKPW